MFVWRKRASSIWLAANEAALCEIAGQRLAIIARPGRRTATAEIAASKKRELERIRSRFGGAIEKLPQTWLARFACPGKARPIEVGTRLTIYRSPTNTNKVGTKNRNLLIPAGAAFGTGDHMTTAMSLRLLEQVTRKGTFSMLDLGTGTGILALAAARFGASRVTAIDHDAIAIATARANARRNEIHNIDFRVSDVRRWKFPRRIEIITANLFSELLIEIAPKFKCAQWLIISGILREQEAQLVRALRRNGIVIWQRRRRGKWMAMLGRPHIWRAGSDILSNALGGSSAECGAVRTGCARYSPG